MADALDGLVEFISTTRPEMLTGTDRNTALLAIRDCVGVGLAGSRFHAPRTLAKLIVKWGANEVSSVWGMGIRTSPPHAAFINGASAHAALFDDNNAPMIGHPSSPLVPALFAVAEEAGLDMDHVLAAYAVGFEVEVRLGRWCHPALYDSGWHATSIFGTLGAAAGVANLLGCSPGQCRHALGIAASMAGGIRQNFGTMVMGLHAGHAAHDGVIAAHLAAQGVTADPEAMTGKLGFYALYAQPRAAVNPATRIDEALVSSFDPLELTRSSLIFKPYPSGAPTHAAVDGALGLLAEFGIDADRVADVECGVQQLSFVSLRTGLPDSGIRAKVSMEYCVGRALVSGSLRLEHFTDTAVFEPRVVALMNRIRMVVDGSLPDNGEFPVRLTITMDDGRRLSALREHPRGSMKAPLSEADHIAKFHDCSAGVLPSETTSRLLEALAGIGTSVSSVSRLLCGEQEDRGG